MSNRPPGHTASQLRKGEYEPCTTTPKVEKVDMPESIETETGAAPVAETPPPATEPKPEKKAPPTKKKKPAGAELKGSMPKGSEHLRHKGAGDPPKKKKPEKGAARRAPADPEQWKHLRDKRGKRFTVGYHYQNEDGSPRLTSDGFLWPLPGRKTKPGGSRVHLGTHEAPLTPDDPMLIAEAEQYHTAAAATVESLVMACTVLGGEDWRLGVLPGMSADNERAQLINAWEGYYRARNMTDVPYWVPMLMANTFYILPRLTAASTKKKAESYRGLWQRLREKFGRKKKPADVKRQAQEERAKEAAGE